MIIRTSSRWQRSCVIVVMFALLLVISLASYGQEKKGNVSMEDVCHFVVVTNTVRVLIQVYDKAGRPVVNLVKEDFIVLEDDIEQDLLFFSKEENEVGGKKRVLYTLIYAPVHNLHGGKKRMIDVRYKEKDKKYKGYYYPMSYVADQ